MKKQAFLLIPLSLLPLILHTSAETLTGQTIGKITIDNRDIFDTSQPSESNPLFKLANGIHIQTRKDFIRRELLIKEGDAYDPALVDETERNLRRFNFL